MTPPERTPLSARRKSVVIWPLAGLAALLVLNAVINPSFLKITLLDGHLYGVPVDILVQGSRTLLVALGMTLVIATGGIDLSVGSVVAIAGGVCAVLLQAGHGLGLTLGAALATGLAAGAINGILVARFGLQPIVATLILMVAGRGVAQLIVDGQVIIIANPAFEFLANGFVLGLPVAPLLVGALYVADPFCAPPHGARTLHRGGGRQRDGQPLRRARRRAHQGARLCLLRRLRGPGRRAGGGQHPRRRCLPRRRNMELDAIFAVVVGGTALTGGRFSILGTAVGALLIQTLTTTMYNLGVPPAVAPGAEGAAHHRGLAAAVGENEPREGQSGWWTSGSARLNASESLRPINEQEPARFSSPPRSSALLFGAAAHFYDGFFSARVITSLLSDNAFLGIAAVGMTLVIFSGGIDLSVGAVIGFTSIFTATLIENRPASRRGWRGSLALRRAPALGAGMGSLICFFRLPPFLITLAGMFLARGAGFWINTDSVGINHGLYGKISAYEWALGTVADPGQRAFPDSGDHGGLRGGAPYALRPHLLAIGGNEHSALLMGLPMVSAKIGVYALSGFCAALAGIVATLYTGSGNPSMGIGLELDAIAIVVIGGTLLTGGRGHVLGTLLGVLIFGTIQAAILFDGRLSSWWMRIVVGALLLVFILLQRFFLRRKSG
jgi:ribose/xylose/arabinose/galactoside ABC-type transport system permease subunit